MQLEIFNVEHGACALLTCDNETRLMIDCGHNSTSGWLPGKHLKDSGIHKLEMLAITNYDEDHVSGANDLFNNIDVQWLWRNKSVSSSTIKTLKSEDGMGAGIERLVNEIEKTFTGNGTSTKPTFQGLERQVFFNSYPTFQDENNLSMVVFLKCHNTGVMFTGDLEREGCIELLKDEHFKQALSATNVLIAPHHGRESGCWYEAVPYLSNVYYVVISDCGYKYDTQKTVPFYSEIAKGGPFRGETRKVLTTRNDGKINFNFQAQSWRPL